uniref:ATP-dependent DNA helicase n=1 Tax=Bracon brevicornis TaxID=1563983 RepID=A0A6V7KSA2_9HYME
MYGRPIQHKSHSVIRLPVHLPNQQNITINEFDVEDGLRSALEKSSMLVEYFSLNQRDPEARNYTYGDIPSQYVYKKLPNTNQHRWEKRKGHYNTIGRMYSVSPTQLELFHLRLLLIAVKGATSFEDLKTVNGQLCDTFHNTCIALGLIEDDQEWERALTEGEIWMMPRQLRHLFVRILIHGHPNHPEELWEQFKDSFSQDFQRNYNESEAQKRAYAHINTLLVDERSSLSAFPTMPSLDEYEIDTNDGNDDQMSIGTHETIGENQYAQLNTKQEEIVDKILNIAMSTEELSSSCFYIDGPGGSGKTFIYTTLYHLLKARGKSICIMAFTGIAAILLPQGKTLHRTFGIPVPIFSDSVSNIKSQSKDAQYLRNVDCFIWDGAPMAPRSAMELIDRTLRDLMDTDITVWGKDYVIRRRLPSVITSNSKCNKM